MFEFNTAGGSSHSDARPSECGEIDDRKSGTAPQPVHHQRHRARDAGAAGVRRRQRRRRPEGGRVQVDGGGADGAGGSFQHRRLRAVAGVAGSAGSGKEDEEAARAIRCVPERDS